MTDTDGTFITRQAGAVAVVWWHYMSMRFRFILAALAPCARVAAQDQIPVRHLGPIVATSTENVGATPSVRVTSSGTVIVGSDPKQRVWVLDSTLRIVSTIRDSTEGTASRGVTSTLVPYLGDSTLMPDVDGTALVVIDPAGKRARVMAPPRVADIYTLAPPSGGHSGVDNGGRLIYRGNPPANAGRAPMATEGPISQVIGPADSVPILRGNFDTRSVETIAWMRQERPNRRVLASRPDPAGGPTIVTMQVLINPFTRSDDWALLSDGSVAVVRVTDYHIDWIEPDGSRRSTPKMPFDWRAYTRDEQRHIADSVLARMQRPAGPRGSSAIRFPGGETLVIAKFEYGIVPDSEYPSFYPPLQTGSAIADRATHVWILPTTSKLAADGFTYDVVDKSGRIIERVQIPKDRVVVGFGPKDDVYLAHSIDGKTFLERAGLR